MSATAHAYEDKLLEFAYGELEPDEARALEAHVKGCGRCTEALGSIRGVRTSMARLADEPAPEAGLESLLAYAGQAARRASAGAPPKRVWWRTWLVSAAGAVSIVVVGVIGWQVTKQS